MGVGRILSRNGSKQDMTIPDNFTKALSQIITALDGQGISWALTGSMGYALQGLPATPNDIDIQTDSQGAYEIEQILSDYISRSVAPKKTDIMRSMLGRLDIEGVKVEIIGDVQKRQPDGSWEDPVDIEDHKLFVEYEGLQVPVMNLDHEQSSYLKMGRLDKAALLADWLKDKDNN